MRAVGESTYGVVTGRREGSGRVLHVGPISLLAVLSVMFLLAAGSASADWNSFRGNRENRGHSDQTLIESANLTWENQLGKGWIDPSTIICNGSVYVFTNGIYDFNAGKQLVPSTLLCLDERKGTVMWQREISDSKVQLSSPGLCNGTIAVGSSDGILYAFDASNGAPVFTFPCSPSTYGITSSPKPVSDGWIFGGGDGSVYRIGTTGKKIWNCDTGDTIYFSSAAVDNGTVYIGNDGGNLSAIDAATGEMLWSHRVGGRIRTSPMVLENMIIFCWSEYSGNLALDGYLRAVDTKGGLLWEANIGASVSSPATDGKRIYVGCNDNRLYCLDMNGGIEWQFRANGPVQSSPAVVNNGILSVSNVNRDGKRSTLYFIDHNGSAIYTYEMSPSEWALSSPAVGAGSVVFASDNGKVYCISDGSFTVKGARYDETEANARTEDDEQNSRNDGKKQDDDGIGTEERDDGLESISGGWDVLLIVAVLLFVYVRKLENVL